jgi:hypothetical protein
LKSIEIINYINSLNEDAYSKFTIKQLYTKLGYDGFMKYVKTVAEACVRRLDVESPIKKVTPHVDEKTHREDGFVIEFEVQTPKFNESLYIVMYLNPPVMRVRYYSEMSTQINRIIDCDHKDLSGLLDAAIKFVYLNKEASKIRQLYFNLPTEDTDPKDYKKYPLESLLQGISFDKLKPFLISSFKEALKTSDYIEIPGLDLNKEPVKIRKSNSTRFTCQGVVDSPFYFKEVLLFSYSFSKVNDYVGDFRSVPVVTYNLSWDVGGDVSVRKEVGTRESNFTNDLRLAFNHIFSDYNVRDVKNKAIENIKRKLNT